MEKGSGYFKTDLNNDLDDAIIEQIKSCIVNIEDILGLNIIEKSSDTKKSNYKSNIKIYDDLLKYYKKKLQSKKTQIKYSIHDYRQNYASYSHCVPVLIMITYVYSYSDWDWGKEVSIENFICKFSASWFITDIV